MMTNNNGHEHDAERMCPGCRINQDLAEHLEWTAGYPEPVWHKRTGEVTTLMCEAVAALTTLRAGRFHAGVADPASATRAAAALSRLSGAIRSLWASLLEDDDDDDDGYGDDGDDGDDGADDE